MSNEFILHEDYSVENNAVNETLFHSANGYIGIRGNFEEGVPTSCNSVRGSFINAFYELESLHYEEDYQGFARENQFILNIFDPQGITFSADGDEFSMFTGKVLDYSRTLNFKKGIVERFVRWESPKGHIFEIFIERLVSFEVKEAFIIRYQIKSINYTGSITINSSLKSKATNLFEENDPRVGKAKNNCFDVTDIRYNDNTSIVSIKTRKSMMSATCASTIKLQENYDLKSEIVDDVVNSKYSVSINEGSSIIFEKYNTYTDCKRHADVAKDNLNINKLIVDQGFESLAATQTKYLDKFWSSSDIVVDGDENLNKGLRFNIYQLLQSAGRDKFSNIPAKGLSGEGYEGHYFWDTEIYMFPFFLYTNPEVARNLLLFRYSILDNARSRARDLSHAKGALYSWRTINGDECSAYYPSGTAQYHINTDIAYSIVQYYQATDDISAISEFGLEILIETARVMYDLGHYRANGDFVLNEVTGPDEYSCCVNNNYYTNVMTKFLFESVKYFWTLIEGDNYKAIERLTKDIGISNSEIDDIYKASKKIFLPYNKELDIHPQDEYFLDRKVWDIKNTPKEKFPLLLHYHPLVMYRHQVCKQPDTVLAHMLLENESKFSTMKNDIEYYEKITTHDSSLSTCIFGIMFSRIGEIEKAYKYFIDTARLDLDNLQGNTHHGIHCASIGGTWLSMVMGFAGMRIIKNELHFKPILPKNWNSVIFNIKFKGRELKVSVKGNDAKIELVSGKSVQVFVNDKIVYVDYQKNNIARGKISTFIFDLDGVITDTAELHYLAWKQLADENNLEFDKDLNEQLKGVSRNASLNIILKHNDKVISDDELAVWADKKNEYYRELLKTITPSDILPGIKSNLIKLREKGLNISLGSASKNATEVLERLKLIDLFDYIGDGNSVKNPKPAPDLFVHVAEHFGVDKSNCVVVEDAASGVAAAKSAGMLAIGIGDKDVLAQADYIHKNTGLIDIESFLTQ